MTDRSALIAQVRASKGDLARPLKTSFTRWRFAAATIGFSGLFIPRILRLSAGNISHTLVEKRERERNVCRRQREAQSGRYPAERSTGPDPFLLTDGRGISSDIILFPSKKKLHLLDAGLVGVRITVAAAVVVVSYRSRVFSFVVIRLRTLCAGFLLSASILIQ